MSSPHRIEYTVSGPTLAAFHKSDAFIRLIRGPVRSGSSVACANELFRQGNEQHLFNGKRRSRFAVVRNTYRELLDTTVKTWKDWFPENIFGKFNKNEMTHYIDYDDVYMEVMFRALDVPDDIKKLLSLELTGAWLNEMREIPKAILDTLTERVGQFPSKREGGLKRAFIICDTNSPDTDHYIWELEQKIKPDGWEFFNQPGALLEIDGKFVPNPLAENVHNLNEGMDYYLKRVPGKKKDHVRVYYCNEYGYVREGRPVHEEYVDSTHCAKKPLEATPDLTITVGIDFGLTPAAVIGQRQVNGQWLILQEVVTERMGISNFCDLLKPILQSDYKDFDFEIWGDPHGVEQAQTDERSPFDIMAAKGIPAEPAYHNNDPIIRRESLFQPLTRMIDGKPGVVLDPGCDVLRRALKGGFCYKRMKVSGSDEMFADKPMKNKFSHVAEALEYLMLGAGEGAEAIRIKKTVEDETHYGRRETSITSPNAWML